MINQQLWDCIERIERLYCDDTITLLDYVLTDDPDDPQYSANTAYHCLEETVLFERLHFQSEIKSVKEYLLAKGYGKEDIELLKMPKDILISHCLNLLQKPFLYRLQN